MAKKFFWGKPFVKVGKTGPNGEMATSLEQFGEIDENTTTFRQEDGSTESKKNEQGDTIKVKTTKGDFVVEYDVLVLDLEMLKDTFGGELDTNGLTLDTDGPVQLSDPYSIEIFGDEGIGLRAPKSDVTVRPEYTADGGLVLHIKHTIIKPETGKMYQWFKVVPVG